MSGDQRGTVDDLATLAEFTESTLLEEIHARYQKGIIYTYIGDILLAMNPYKDLNIYSNKMLRKYTHVMMKSKLPPHIFAISDHSYSSMIRSGVKQCCIICGESGSGKTESTKLMIKHIIQICNQENNLLQRIIEVNPLLEAFGNAKTVINDNSSRFGKYVEILFDFDGQIEGAKISDYLLEKSRVIQQAPWERNFHIFYYMFAGLDERKRQINLLNKPADHRILKPADGSEIYDESGWFNNGRQLWEQTQNILKTVGFDHDQRESITAMLTAIVHITDICFLHDTDTDGSFIENEEKLEIASMLLGVRADEFGGALTTNETTVKGLKGNEKIIILKNIYQSADGRDALAKALYGRLFGWIIRQINNILKPRSTSSQTEIRPSIGILDIYGFENFKTNSFEQMCINMANEQIHFYFTQHIFKMEMEEYSKEGIKGNYVQFKDNKPIVDLFFEKNGLYDLLDEESKFPKANDLTLIEKMERAFVKRPVFQRPKTQNLQFVIQHYAGFVSYCVSGFLEKNRDLLSINLQECMQKSESFFVADLFSAKISSTGSLEQNDPQPNGRQARNRPSVLLLDSPMPFDKRKRESVSQKILRKPDVKRPVAEENRGSISKTLSSYFKSSLASLLDKMQRAEPHFIRCICPNQSKQPDSFVNEVVLRQLSYTGVLQTVVIRRQGYAIRLTFEAFLNRYKFIAFPMSSKVKCGPKNCTKVLLQAKIENFEIGKTKVFLRYYHAEQLDALMIGLISQVVTIQKYYRSHLARRLYENMKKEEVQRNSSIQLNCEHSPKPPPPRTKLSTVNSIYSGIPNTVFELMLEESMSSLQEVNVSFWGKLHMITDQGVLAKFLLRESQVVLNGSDSDYATDGATIGLKAYILDFVGLVVPFQEIGKGVEISRDSEGNVFMRNLGNCSVIVNGYRCEKLNCLSDEAIYALGRIGPERLKVFDIQKFKSYIAEELRQVTINIPRIEALSMVVFNFACKFKACFAIINFSALDILGNHQALPELKRMAGLNLNAEDEQYLRNTWSKMQRRPDSGMSRSNVTTGLNSGAIPNAG